MDFNPIYNSVYTYDWKSIIVMDFNPIYNSVYIESL